MYNNWPSLIFYAAFFIVTFYVLFLYMVFICGYFSARKSTFWATKLLSYMLTLNLSYLFIPIVGTLLSMSICISNNLLVQSTVTCWTPTHSAFCAMGFLFAFLLCLSQIIAATIFYSTEASAKNILARFPAAPTSIFVLEQLLKLLLVAIQFSITSSVIKQWLVVCLISIVYSYIFFISMRQRIYRSHFTDFVISFLDCF